jgi:hypothetical protein
MAFFGVSFCFLFGGGIWLIGRRHGGGKATTM